MSLADFNWFSDKLWDDLQQDPLGRGKPLTVEAQVAIGLDHLGHDSGYVTIKRFSTVLFQKLCYQRNKFFDCSKVLHEEF
jgi:hypothetical protein